MASTSSTCAIPLQNITTSFPCSSHPTKSSLRFPYLPPFSSQSIITRLKSTMLVNETIVIEEGMDKIRRLQNGSDVRGVALEGEKGRKVDLTPAAVEAIVESFGEWVVNGMENKGEDVRISLGRDPRVTGSSECCRVFGSCSCRLCGFRYGIGYYSGLFHEYCVAPLCI